ncbi:MAG: cardiolipin synthase B, partial [Candidatus Rokuibacteriota bacterium]
MEDEGFAGRMEDMYLDDLGRSTEITLTERARLVKHGEGFRPPGGRAGSAGRAPAGAVSIGSAVGAA